MAGCDGAAACIHRCPRVGFGAGRTQVVGLCGGSTGESKRLRLTEPATGRHSDVHGCIRGNISLAASDLTHGVVSECQVQVVQHMAFPTQLGEEMKRVCVPLAFRRCLLVCKQTALRFCMCINTWQLTELGLLLMHKQPWAPAFLTVSALLTEIENNS